MGVVAVALLLFLAYDALFLRPSGQPLAETTCPFFGDARIEIASNVAAEDTLPVRRHEAVHAAQCRELGPFTYRMRNLTSAGKLALEAPAYCASASARISQGMDTSRARVRMLDDIGAAFARTDAADVRAALRTHCPAILMRS
jgi:hypothetical protein